MITTFSKGDHRANEERRMGFLMLSDFLRFFNQENKNFPENLVNMFYQLITEFICRLIWIKFLKIARKNNKKKSQKINALAGEVSQCSWSFSSAWNSSMMKERNHILMLPNLHFGCRVEFLLGRCWALLIRNVIDFSQITIQIQLDFLQKFQSYS